MMNRRAFLVGMATVGSAATLSGPAFAQTSRQRLAMPPLLDATKSGRFSLRAQAGQTNFLDRATSDTIGFNQAYLGPVVRVTQGETEATVENTLNIPISTHWHGLLVPGDVDGGPHQPVLPGETWRVTLPITQPSATAWYHSHIHEQTAAQVHAGLAGVLQITDGRDDERGLPGTYGTDDLTLVVQDRRFDRRGRLNYSSGMHETMVGFLGDTVVVNGQIGRVAVIPAGIVRLRLLNGSNARIYRFSMASGRDLHLIASDAGLLPAAVALKDITLAPGERVELLIDFSGAETDSLVSAVVSNTPMMGGMMGGSGDGGVFDVQKFVVDPGLTPRIATLPTDTGEALPDLNPADAVQRQFSLDMGMGGGMMGGMMGRRGGAFSINGAPFDMSHTNLAAKRGQT
ncbi:MAG: blue copper oxidase, partial [Paracoccaceae bacterium]